MSESVVLTDNSGAVIDNSNDTFSTEPSDDSPCNLIVKYLPETMTEEGLKNLFSSYGNIIKCRIISDKATGRSKGYGFVKFESEENAKAATVAMQGYSLENKVLKVNAASVGQKKVSNQPPANVYVAGLPPTFTKQDLDNLFRPFGELVEAKMLFDKNSGQHKGVGFVHFANYENAVDAIRSLHGSTVDGALQGITVKFARQNPNASNKQAQSNTPYASLLQTLQAAADSSYGPIRTGSNYGANPNSYNQNFGYGANNSGFYAPYGSYGDGNGSNYGYDPNNAINSGFGYGQGDMSGFGFNMGMNPNANLNNNSQDNGLFVFHIPASCDEERLRQLFATFGTVTQCKIMVDPQTGHSKGFGFVNMSTLEQAQAAVINMNGHAVDGKYLKVSFKKKK